MFVFTHAKLSLLMIKGESLEQHQGGVSMIFVCLFCFCLFFVRGCACQTKLKFELSIYAYVFYLQLPPINIPVPQKGNKTKQIKTKQNKTKQKQEKNALFTQIGSLLS